MRAVTYASVEIDSGACQLIVFAATTDPRRANTFYRNALGLPLVSEDRFALVFDAHGIMIRSTVGKVAAAEYTVLGWQVPDIVESVDDLRRAGVRFERYSRMGQDERGIWQSPSGAKVAWFKDPDGNTLSLTQF